MTRTNGFWKRGDFRLVRFADYDNSAARRVWLPPGAGKGAWAWAIAVADLETFHEIYRDRRRQTLHPQRDARAWTVEWHSLDSYIRGGATPPSFEEFDPSNHVAHVTSRLRRCWCDCGRVESFGSWVEIEWAVYVEGPMSHRRTHPVRPLF